MRLPETAAMKGDPMPLAMLCPFFKKEKDATATLPARLNCEGGTLNYRDRQMRRDLVYKMCAGDYQSCQIYQLLTESYDRDDN